MSFPALGNDEVIAAMFIEEELMHAMLEVWLLMYGINLPIYDNNN